MRHKILLHSNPTWIKTGLAENAKTLLRYLYKTQKYDLAHYCSQCSVADGNLNYSPWKSYGCLPTDPNVIQELNRDLGKARNASYGAWHVDNVIKEFQPTIYLGIDDPWGFPKADYMDKPWWKQLTPMLHITLDSLPILEQALEQAELTKNYYTWVKFAANEMKRLSPKYGHVEQVYGAIDTQRFSPISKAEKADLRKRFNISDDTVVFNFIFRNQLRKSANLILDAFSKFKNENKNVKAKIHFHTSVSEKGSGWDFPKMINYYGINPADVLFTYVCRNCGSWHIMPYAGEDVKCPYCNAEKSMITANITCGVHEDEMRYVHGFSDASISAFTSGGFEYFSAQALLCGQPLACTNYFCGADFCEQDFVYNLEYHPYHEPGTNFIKAATDVNNIKNFMQFICQMPVSQRDALAAKGREWAEKTFDIKTVGAQWEKIFDAVPIKENHVVSIRPEPKNDKFPFPSEIENEDDFITALYREILKMDEPKHGEGFKNWKAQLANGVSRENVWQYFIGVAQQENAKNGLIPQDFWSLIDRNRPNKRLLITIKESGGDCLLITQLLESAREEYPDYDIYVGVEQKFHEIFYGNPYVHKILPYHGAMEQEMIMCGAGHNDPYFHKCIIPGIPTQRHLGYLWSDTAAFSKHIRK